MDENESHKIAEYCKETLSLENVVLGDEYNYSCVPLCVIDSVFSIGVRYEGVKKVIKNTCEYLGLEPTWTENYSGISTTEFLSRTSHLNSEELAEKVFKNRQRTSTANGILKANAVIEFLKVLQKHNVERLLDVRAVYDSEAFENDIKQIPGQKSGISTRYFFMLAGEETFIKPDRMIIRFIQSILNRNVSPKECQALLQEACSHLNASYPSLTPKALDHEIWAHQRNFGPNEDTQTQRAYCS